MESTPPKKRRRFAASEKLRLLKAADAALATGELGALEALLRKEGIYSSHLSAWRQQPGARGTTGLAPQKPGRKPKLDDKDRQLLAMTNELAVVKRKLLIANGLISLPKKAREIAPTSCEPSPTTLAYSPPAIDGVLKALTRVARPPPLLRDHTHPTQQPPPLSGVRTATRSPRSSRE